MSKANCDQVEPRVVFSNPSRGTNKLYRHVNLYLGKTKAKLIALSCLMATAFSPCFAQDIQTGSAAAGETLNVSDRWKFGAEIYLWGADMGIKTQAGDEIDLSFSDLVSNLKMGAMGSFTAQKGKLTFFSDLIYLDLGDSTSSTANIIGRPISTSVDVDIKGVINTTGLGYSIYNTGATEISALGGFRYLWLDTKLNFDIGSAGTSVNTKDTFFDAVVGLRGQSDINEDLYVTYYLDVGAGQSDLTWQVFAGLNYRFKNFDAVFGYRYMDWDLGSDTSLSGVTVKGPVVGLKFTF